ncbi:MAG: PilZ domain-containing protein [Candidatus Omnitrophica bacterium]|nr:PilZ domain-containing protein [Candidatus Omnitrophota bacterium]MDD5166413.1 PilZ domain-containing protein [Candidatus Omnitrophota bacterium]
MESILDKENKRRFPRVELHIPLRYQIRGRPDFNNAICEDISVNGVGFTNDRFIPPLSKLTLELNVLSRSLSPIVTVAWSSPLPHSNKYHLGVEFLELNPVEKRYLGDYVDMQRGKI